MRWLFLARKETDLLVEMRSFLVEHGESVDSRYMDAIMGKFVLDFDVIVLKSRIIPFFYGGYLAKMHGKIVFPDPMTAYRLRNRWEAEIYLREMGLNVPPAVMGYRQVLEREMEEGFFPAVKKPLMGSKNTGIELIRGSAQLEAMPSNEVIYLQKMVDGDHYEVDFIEEDIYIMEKEPMVHETLGIHNGPVPGDIVRSVRRYRKASGLLFGDLDVVIGDETWIVDPGTFPPFNHVKDAGAKIGGLLLDAVIKRTAQ